MARALASNGEMRTSRCMPRFGLQIAVGVIAATVNVALLMPASSPGWWSTISVL